tara:strand:+ start:249 stop:461 length:213 start_codon:yes stop_codon:yes gene_type:complete
MGVNRVMKKKKKLTKKDFLEIAANMDYSLDQLDTRFFKSDTDLKQQMKSWNLKHFQEWFDFKYISDDGLE